MSHPHSDHRSCRRYGPRCSIVQSRDILRMEGMEWMGWDSGIWGYGQAHSTATMQTFLQPFSSPSDSSYHPVILPIHSRNEFQARNSSCDQNLMISHSLVRELQATHGSYSAQVSKNKYSRHRCDPSQSTKVLKRKPPQSPKTPDARVCSCWRDAPRSQFYEEKQEEKEIELGEGKKRRRRGKEVDGRG
ncbi:hypothetical protein P152DRAFT_207130 [Eremomyces bilateralis CBS 781.70]|uniref:Uncharacterized protein n=1 Tax=Eremomyces bilateralis CBS 781.70 TaxID=1392243 RepID=A0A6G1FT89_9PEZI|nr:uncharacterized protein P152DRAFT_207130 [Eremomyces bilateralis CBS 781.70]KAF1808889.1 hypothetical protein P152DRAFT_207130 [Eremomyces bilateralis CBS 781.70]